MATSYISSHHGGGWRYGFHIPKELRALWGNKRAFFRYIPRCSRREAEAKARSWAVDDAHRLEQSRKIWSSGERAAIAAAGGLPSLLKSDPPEGDPKYWLRMRAQAIEAAVVEENRKVTDDATVLAVSWDALLAEWIKVKEPRRTRDHATTIRLLKEFFGDRDCRKLSVQEIGKFRDDLVMTKQAPPGMVKTRLGHIHAIFKSVSGEPTSPFAGMPNPASGVRVLGKVVKYKSRDPFSPEQARHIIETAKAIRFGDTNRMKRHEDILWILRLLAFTGARPNEIAQLQGGDIEEQDGIRFIHIRNIDAVTGKHHPQKSLKRGETARKVPIHPGMMDFYDYARGLDKGAFVFDVFKAKNGRADYLIQKFSPFLKEDCKIIDPTKELVLYSFRHRFHVAMIEAGIPETLQYRLTGHKLTTHQKYGGDMLDQLAEKIKLVKPLG